MPWKEPGKGDKDPWNSGNSQPPDLDDVFKNVKSRLNSIFGGGSGRNKSDSGSGGSGSGGMFSLILLLIVISELMTGLPKHFSEHFHSSMMSNSAMPGVGQ